MIYIGIDPGLTGAVAAIDGSSGFMAVWDMPTIGQGRGKTLDAEQLVYELDSLNLGALSAIAIIERVASRPAQGVASTFKFGYGAGVIEGILAALPIRYRFVTPRQWKAHLGLIGCDKHASRDKAASVFPAAADQLRRAKDHGRAEAILLAAYGMLTGVGE